MVRVRVTVPVAEREEDPDTEVLPEALGEVDTLEEEHLESVPLTVPVEDTVVVGDWDKDLVRVRVTVPVEE